MTWKRQLENPIVLAAFVGSLSSLAVSVVASISGAISGHFQAVAESKRNVLSVVMLHATPQETIEAFIAAGLLDDGDCAIRKAAFHYTGDCKPPPQETSEK